MRKERKFKSYSSFLLSLLGTLLFANACSNQDPIHEAAEMCDVEAIEKYLAEGADINSNEGRDGETPLHRAATRGQFEAAKLLISKGAKLNLGRTRDGQTPLDLADSREHSEIVQLLRENGGKKSSEIKNSQP